MTCEELTAEEIDAFLDTHWFGILSLANADGESYAVPESYGYDDSILYFQFLYTKDSMKMEFVEDTATVTFTVYDPNILTSVIVRGTLEPVADADALVGGAFVAEQTEFPDIYMYPETNLSDQESAVYRLVPDTVTGRRWTKNISLTEDDSTLF